MRLVRNEALSRMLVATYVQGEKLMDDAISHLNRFAYERQLVKDTLKHAHLHCYLVASIWGGCVLSLIFGVLWIDG